MEISCAPYSALAIANFFLENHKSISPMKLQKLVYFAHGWNLAISNNPLIKEPIEAWDYGPVISTIYNEFKLFGGSNKNRLAI